MASGQKMDDLADRVHALVEKAPKLISPRAHGWLDYLTTAGFLAAGLALGRRDRRALALALSQAGFVLGYSLFTDYPLALRRVIPFPVHARLDLAQAALAAGLPELLGAAGGGFFRGQAVNELMVLLMTDFHGQRPAARRQLTLVGGETSMPRAISRLERWSWLGAGGVLVAAALRRRSKASLPLAAAGALMLQQAARRTRTHPARVEHGEERVVRALAILRSPEELYRAWSDPEMLARFLPHVESVTARHSRHLEWRLRTSFGRALRWETEVTSSQPDELISWRTVAGTPLCDAATIRFRRGAPDRGTIVELEMITANTRAGWRATVAGILGESPTQMAREGLRRCKQYMETGEIATITGQPAGPRTAAAKFARRFDPNFDLSTVRPGAAA